MRFIKFFFIVLGFSFLQSCSNPSLYQSKHYVFGTIVDISIYGEDEKKAEKVTKAVLEEFTFDVNLAKKEAMPNQQHTNHSACQTSRMNTPQYQLEP